MPDAATSGRHSIGDQSGRDLAKSMAPLALADDESNRALIERAHPAHVLAFRAFGRHSFARALADQQTLVLGHGDEHVRHQVACRSRCVHAEIECHERPFPFS